MHAFIYFESWEENGKKTKFTNIIKKDIAVEKKERCCLRKIIFLNNSKYNNNNNDNANNSFDGKIKI